MPIGQKAVHAFPISYHNSPPTPCNSKTAGCEPWKVVHRCRLGNLEVGDGGGNLSGLRHRIPINTPHAMQDNVDTHFEKLEVQGPRYTAFVLGVVVCE
jgi:hypothetical protein